MDRNYMGMIIGVSILLLVITLTINAQQSAIMESASFSKANIGYSMKASAATLHIWNRPSNDDFGRMRKEEFDNLVSDCGSDAGLRAQNSESSSSDIKLLDEDNIESCIDLNQPIYGVLSSVRVYENQEESSEWLLVG